jgi:hypothetical protein
MIAEETWERFTLDELPPLNRAILARAQAPSALVHALNTRVLPALPPPAALTPWQARRLVVHLGLWGSSVSRHLQEADLSLLERPEVTLEVLHAGAAGVPFQAYFAEVALRTGAGHAPRDTYASLVRWNVPTVDVVWQGERLVTLEGAFEGPHVRTYTGDPGEVLFLVLLKKAEALEAAANELIEPLAAGDAGYDHDAEESLARMRRAASLLLAVHHTNHQFTATGEGGAMLLSADHFIDVLRQFAVHWRRGDVPPSGAQDPEYLARDLLLGIEFPGYDVHVRRVFPALLEEERERLERWMSRPSLPHRVLLAAGFGPADLAAASADALLEMARRWPSLAACYLLMRANAKVSSSHLGLTKRFLFNPMRARDRQGIADSPLVSNRAGTTGMLEQLLERLNRGRQEHLLSPFARVPLPELEAIAGAAAHDAGEPVALLRSEGRENQAENGRGTLGAPISRWRREDPASGGPISR